MTVGNVKLEIAASSEASFAEAAPIRRVVSVYVRVELQVGQFIEGFVTQAASIRFLPGVN